ncbi:MAG: 3-coathanger stack domain-containing protein [Bacteroidota bacterium]
MKKIIIPFLLIGAIVSSYGQNTLRIVGNNFKIVGTTSLVLENTRLINNGIFDADSSTVYITGNGTTANSEIEGFSNTIFYNININKSANGARLGNSMQVNKDIIFTSGTLDLNGHNITLGTTNGQLVNESANARVISSTGGQVIKTTNINVASAVNPGNLGLTITNGATLGNTTIRRGHQPRGLPTGDDFQRYFEIVPTNNSGLNATLRFSYFDVENPLLAEATMELWQYAPQTSWVQQSATSRSNTNNFLEKTALTTLASIWTIAGSTSVDNDGDGSSVANGDCDDTDITNPTDSLINTNPIQEDSYIVTNSITSSGTVQANHIVQFKAGQMIDLLPGFTANEGSDFLAIVEACGIPPSALTIIHDEYQMYESNERQENIAGEDSFEVEMVEREKVIKKENLVQFRVFPNPFQSQTTFDYFLSEDTPVSVQVFDINGKLIETVLDGLLQSAGIYQINYTSEKMLSGVYFVIFRTKHHTFTERIVRIGD